MKREESREQQVGRVHAGTLPVRQSRCHVCQAVVRWTRKNRPGNAQTFRVEGRNPCREVTSMDSKTRSRFDSKHSPSPEPHPALGTHCWLWKGGVDRDGYGYFMLPTKPRWQYAHKVSYQTHRGNIPTNMMIDHLCRVRNCVNPDHLEIVTPQVNVLRGISFAAKNAVKTHCNHGHEFSKSNIIKDRNGNRNCRECARGYSREYQRRKRASARAAKLAAVQSGATITK